VIPKVTSSGKTALKVAWNSVKVDGYDVFVNDKLVKTVKGTSYKASKLKKGKSYKIVVKGWVKHGGERVYVNTSPTVYGYTYGKYTNPSKVTVNKSKVTLKKGKTFKLKTKVKNSKKTLNKTSLVRYINTNSSVASISSSGKIKAKKKGTCYIYVYAHNGISKKIKVIVR